MEVQVVPDGVGFRDDRILIAAVAFDLMASYRDVREAAAGRRVLQELIDEFR